MQLPTVSRVVLLGILGGGVPPGSPNPDPISDQKCNFPHQFSDQTSKINPYPFSDLAFRQKLCGCHYLDQRANKTVLQIHFEFAYFSFLLTHLEWKRLIFHTFSQFPQNPYPIPDQNGYSVCIPVFRPKRQKNPTRWCGTYLYSSFMGIPPPPPRPMYTKEGTDYTWNKLSSFVSISSTSSLFNH